MGGDRTKGGTYRKERPGDALAKNSNPNNFTLNIQAKLCFIDLEFVVCTLKICYRNNKQQLFDT